MFLNILLFSLILLILAMLGLALNILVKKKGRFPAYRVGHNRDMHKLGISCVKHDEIRCHKKKIAGSEGSELSADAIERTSTLSKEQDCAGCQQLAQ